MLRQLDRSVQGRRQGRGSTRRKVRLTKPRQPRTLGHHVNEQSYFLGKFLIDLQFSKFCQCLLEPPHPSGYVSGCLGRGSTVPPPERSSLQRESSQGGPR